MKEIGFTGGGWIRLAVILSLAHDRLNSQYYLWGTPGDNLFHDLIINNNYNNNYNNKNNNSNSKNNNTEDDDINRFNYIRASLTSSPRMGDVSVQKS